MQPYLSALGQASISVLIMMFGVWLISLWKRNAGIIDIFWSLGFVLVSGIYFFQGSVGQDDAIPRRLLVLGLVAIWGFRLAMHIFLRGLGHGEDYRYAAMRKRGGRNFWWRSFIFIFCLQGALIVFVSLPLLWIFLSPQPNAWQWTDGLAIVLWTVGFFFESVGDWQLTRFKKNPANKGQVMDRGLWAWTRHPNYFGDFTVWWGFFAFTLAVPGGWWAVVSVLLMSFLLMKVSGVALLEKTISKRRPGYQEYMERTPAFFPAPPRR